jgi:hypothetical protein
VRSLTLALLVLLANPVRAQLTAPELSEARTALIAYDLRGSTTAVLADLTRFLDVAEDGDRREARYLRAVAATDLLILASSQIVERVRGEVAEALGVAPAELDEFLLGELRAVDLGAYRSQVAECRWALGLLRGGDAAELRAGEGLRRDILYVHRMVDALGLPDTIERLAAYGEDPCARPGPCVLSGFAEDARRAVDALLEAEAALVRLEGIQEAGEPLTASMATLVATDVAVLRTTTLHPAPSLPERVHGVGVRGDPARPELLFIVEPDRVLYGFATAIRVSGGAVHLVSPGSPALPRTAEIPWVDDRRTVVVPHEELTEQAQALLVSHSLDRVGVAVSGDVDAFRMSRVLASLSAAGITSPDLIARGLRGEARRVRVEVSLEDEFARSPLHLFIRMGGYTLWSGGRGESIPRIRDPRGRLRFDLSTLEERAALAPETRGQLRYMTSVDWQTVLDAAFHLPEEAWPLTVFLH